MSTERVIVQQGAAPTLVQELTALFKQAKAGDTKTEPSAVLDALFTDRSAENVVGMIKEAVSDGATLIVGDLSRQGAVVQPHILMNVRPGMRLWERESFGPGTYLIRPNIRRSAMAETIIVRCGQSS